MFSRASALGTPRARVVDMDLRSMGTPGCETDSTSVSECETEEAVEADLFDRLLGCAELLMGDLAERAFEVGLSRPQFLVLRELARRGMPMRPYQLAGVLGCSRANVSRIIQRLVEAAYVAEEPLWLSPRSKTVSVTPSGHDAYTRATRTADHPPPLRSLDARQQKQLRRLLARVQSAFEEQLPR